MGLGVSQELSQLVAECLSVRREEVRAQLVRDSCSVSHCHLTDYDWKLKVSAHIGTVSTSLRAGVESWGAHFVL